VAPEGEQSQFEIDNSLQGSQGGTVTSSGVQFKPEQLQQLLAMLQQSYTKSSHSVSQISSGNVDESSSQQQNRLSGKFLSKFAIRVNLPNGITSLQNILVVYNFLKTCGCIMFYIFLTLLST